MVFIYITGYKRSGKDTLYKDIVNKSLYKWKIYKKPNINIQIKELLNEKWYRLSFADNLKEIIRDNFFKNYTLHELETIKDEKIFNNKSFRDYCIDYGEKMRLLDKDYWVKLALNSVNFSNNYIVTDWRYKNEIEYLQKLSIFPYTIRVFRNVTIPEENNEHILDDVKTDYLIISRDNNLNDALNIFKQYKNYELLD